MKRTFVSHADRQVALGAVAAGDGWMVQVDAEEAGRCALVRAAPGVVLVESAGVVRPVRLSTAGDLCWLGAADHTSRWRRVEVARGRHGHADAVLRAPMTGRVVVVAVAPGDAVTKGQTLVAVEAMKMEHAIKAPREGVVDRVACRVGDQVDTGQDLIALRDAP